MSLFVEIENLVSAKLAVVKTAATILKLETKLAGLTVYPLLLNLCLLLVGLFGIWTSSMLAIGYLLALWVHNILLCILGILFLNLGIVCGLLKYLSFNLKNMSFEKTRKFMSNKEHLYVEQKKTNSTRTDNNRTSLALPRSSGQRKKK